MSNPSPLSLTPENVARIPVDELLDLEHQLCFAVYSLSHSFNRAYKVLLKDFGLTYPQYLVMLVLWESGSSSVGYIGDRLRLDSGTLTPLLKRMEAAGLVERRRAPEDERQVMVELTEKGRMMRIPAADVPRTLLCTVGSDDQKLYELRNTLLILQQKLNVMADKGR